MQRYGMVIGLRKEKLEEYKKLHEAAWPEILTLIARGQSAKEIARDLDISVRTAETHRQNIRRKLGAKNSAELTLIAVKNGLVSPFDANDP